MSDRIAISPLAHKLAKEKGVDISAIKGSGPGGRIIKRDVDGYEPTQRQSPSEPNRVAIASTLPDPRLYADKADYDEIELSPMQVAIAARLSAAKQTMPHFYLTRRINMGAVVALRHQLNIALAERGEKLSLNDFIVRATALALVDEPDVNISFADTAILRHHHADIGVAVALEDGLITPIIRKAEDKSVQTISREIKELASRATARRLKPREYEGGSFSISNLGMYNIDHFTAVINPPQAAILAVGGLNEELYRAQDGEIHSRQTMTVTLSCDHRAINGATGARFLETLAQYCAEPYLMMFD